MLAAVVPVVLEVILALLLGSKTLVAREAGDGGIGYDAATNVPWMTTAGGEAGYFGAGGGGGATDPAPNGTGGQKGLGGGGVGDGQNTSAENQTARALTLVVAVAAVMVLTLEQMVVLVGIHSI